jgi:3-isopropylmalate dehydratase small subunit
MIVKYPVVNNRVLPPEADATQIVTMRAESAIMSIVMDELNVEGILGTSLGNIFYLNLEVNQLIRLVSRASNGLDSVNLVRFDSTNQAVFLSSTGEQSGEIKLFTTGTLD